MICLGGCSGFGLFLSLLPARGPEWEDRSDPNGAKLSTKE